MTQPDRPTVRRRSNRRHGMAYTDTLRTPGLSAHARLAYALLCTYAGADRDAWPSAGLQADELGIGRSSLYRALAELEAAGIIEREQRTTETGRSITTRVTLLDDPDDVDELPEAEALGTTSEAGLAPTRTRQYAILWHHILTDPRLSTMARLAYLGLTIYAGRTVDGGETRAAWPTPTRLALELEVARQSIYKGLGELEAADIIRRRRRADADGNSLPTVVTLYEHRRPPALETPVPDVDPVYQRDTPSVPDVDTPLSSSGTLPVYQRDTRSVPDMDTNNYQENIGARAYAERFGLCASCHTLHSSAEPCSSAAERRRAAASAAASGAATVRAAARAQA